MARIKANNTLCHSEHLLLSFRTPPLVIPNTVRNPALEKERFIAHALNDKLIVNGQWLIVMPGIRYPEPRGTSPPAPLQRGEGGCYPFKEGECIRLNAVKAPKGRYITQKGCHGDLHFRDSPFFVSDKIRLLNNSEFTDQRKFFHLSFSGVDNPDNGKNKDYNV